ncbi:MAG: hypothetical protein R3F35_20745 [Myxococcota bacterium]
MRPGPSPRTRLLIAALALGVAGGIVWARIRAEGERPNTRSAFARPGDAPAAAIADAGGDAASRARGAGAVDSTPEATLPPDASQAVETRAADAGAEDEAEDATSPTPPGSPEDAAYAALYGEPTPELMRRELARALDAGFTDLRLSPAEIERASDALYRLRETRVALDALPMEPDTAAERRRLVEALGEATSTFRDVTRMDPAEFTSRALAARGGASGGIGIDRDAAPGGVGASDGDAPDALGGAAPMTGWSDAPGVER